MRPGNMRGRAVAFVYNGTSIKGDSENAASLSAWHNFKVAG